MSLAADLPHVPEELRPALEEAVRRIVAIARPEVVILFGSYAEGGADEDSDIDLLVVAQTEERLPLTVRVREAIDPVLDPYPLDVIVIPAEHWSRSRRLRGMVCWEADHFGARLYERAA